MCDSFIHSFKLLTMSIYPFSRLKYHYSIIHLLRSLSTVECFLMYIICNVMQDKSD